jgi:hypothetical protein
MKPTTAAICGFFVAILNSGIANAADTLECKLGPNVVVSIAKVDCPLKAHAEKYPWGAVAFNAQTNQYLFDCFRKYDENIIEIQWAKGDTSGLPANCFLMGQKEKSIKGEF